MPRDAVVRLARLDGGALEEVGALAGPQVVGEVVEALGAHGELVEVAAAVSHASVEEPAYVLEVVAKHAALDEVAELVEREHGELAVAVLDAVEVVAQAAVDAVALLAVLARALARTVAGLVPIFCRWSRAACSTVTSSTPDLRQGFTRAC